MREWNVPHLLWTSLRRLSMVLIGVTAIGGFGAALAPAVAQAKYPDRAVSIIIAWPAGGATDLVGRVFQEAFSKAVGGQTIIKNVVGAAGTIGATEAAMAPADGHTLLLTPIGPMVIQPHRMKLTYDPASFAPVCKLTDSPIILMSPPNSRFKTVKDVVEAAKAEPGKLAYASTGPGTIPHISMLGFGKASGVNMKHVPYKGSADVMQATLSGTIEVSADQPNLVPQYNLTPIAVFGEKRAAGLPDVPTMKEAGLDLKFSIWNALFAPKGTPEPILAQLEAECKLAMEDKGVVENLGKQQQPIDYKNRVDLASFVADEFKKAKVLIEDAGLTAR